MSGDWVVSFPHGHGFGPDWRIIRSLFRFGLPTGIQGIAMNVGGVHARFYRFTSRSRSSGGVRRLAQSLFSLITWTSVGLMSAAAAVAGQNLGAGRPDRADAAVHIAASFGFAGAALVGCIFLFFRDLWHFRHERPGGRRCRRTAARAQRFRRIYCGRADVLAAFRGRAIQRARSTSRSPRKSSCRWASVS